MVLQSYHSDQTRPSTSLSRLKWNDQFLDSMRQVGDPLADEAIQVSEKLPTTGGILTSEKAIPPTAKRYGVA